MLFGVAQRPLPTVRLPDPDPASQPNQAPQPAMKPGYRMQPGTKPGHNGLPGMKPGRQSLACSTKCIPNLDGKVCPPKQPRLKDFYRGYPNLWEDEPRRSPPPP